MAYDELRIALASVFFCGMRISFVIGYFVIRHFRAASTCL
jgi:hypothetical protein